MKTNAKKLDSSGFNRTQHLQKLVHMHHEQTDQLSLTVSDLCKGTPPQPVKSHQPACNERTGPSVAQAPSIQFPERKKEKLKVDRKLHLQVCNSTTLFGLLLHTIRYVH